MHLQNLSLQRSKMVDIGIGILYLIRLLYFAKNNNNKSKKQRIYFEEDQQINQILDECLPQDFINLILSSSLCHLSLQDDPFPHMTTMYFTFVKNDDLIILTSYKDSKKFKLIQKNPEVSILLHDFQSHRLIDQDENLGISNTYSVVITGIAVIQSGQKEKYFRNLHIQKNKHIKSKFIHDQDLSIITVRILHLRLSNIQNEVFTWQSKAWRIFLQDQQKIINI